MKSWSWIQSLGQNYGNAQQLAATLEESHIVAVWNTLAPEAKGRRLQTTTPSGLASWPRMAWPRSFGSGWHQVVPQSLGNRGEVHHGSLRLVSTVSQRFVGLSIKFHAQQNPTGCWRQAMGAMNLMPSSRSSSNPRPISQDLSFFQFLSIFPKSRRHLMDSLLSKCSIFLALQYLKRP